MYSATGTVGAAQYCNIGTASGSTATASDAACYRVPPPPRIAIVKLVNGLDADVPADGPVLTPGAVVTWTYVVTNPGPVSLADVVVSDDNGTPAIAGDDFVPTFIGGDANGNGLLDVGEVYSATGTVGAAQYCNVGTASGSNAGVTATATDTACYRVTVAPPPQISVVKDVNGHDANTQAEAVLVEAGDVVTWTYRVTTSSPTPLSGVTLVDDHGIPGNPADDVQPAYQSGDTNGNGPPERCRTPHRADAVGYGRRWERHRMPRSRPTINGQG